MNCFLSPFRNLHNDYHLMHSLFHHTQGIRHWASCSARSTYWPQSSLPSSKAPTLPSSCTCSIRVCLGSYLCHQVWVFTTSSTVRYLNNIHKLLASNTRASMVKYKNLSHHAAVKTSIHTGNTKLHISNETHKTSLQDTGLFNVTQYTDLFKSQRNTVHRFVRVLRQDSGWLGMCFLLHLCCPSGQTM